MRLFFAIIVGMLLLAGCGGSHCIKVGGTYQGVAGNVEYCFSEEKSASNKLPTLESGGTTQVIVDEGALDKLISKVEGTVGKLELKKKSLRERLDAVLKDAVPLSKAR